MKVETQRRITILIMAHISVVSWCIIQRMQTMKNSMNITQNIPVSSPISDPPLLTASESWDGGFKPGRWTWSWILTRRNWSRCLMLEPFVKIRMIAGEQITPSSTSCGFLLCWKRFSRDLFMLDTARLVPTAARSRGGNRVHFLRLTALLKPR